MEELILGIPRSQYPNVNTETFRRYINNEPSDGGFVNVPDFGVIYVPGRTPEERYRYAKHLEMVPDFFISPQKCCSVPEGVSYGTLTDAIRLINYYKQNFMNLQNCAYCGKLDELLEYAKTEGVYNLAELENLYIIAKALPGNNHENLAILKNLIDNFQHDFSFISYISQLSSAERDSIVNALYKLRSALSSPSLTYTSLEPYRKMFENMNIKFPIIMYDASGQRLNNTVDLSVDLDELVNLLKEERNLTNNNNIKSYINIITLTINHYLPFVVDPEYYLQLINQLVSHQSIQPPYVSNYLI